MDESAPVDGRDPRLGAGGGVDAGGVGSPRPWLRDRPSFTRRWPAGVDPLHPPLPARDAHPLPGGPGGGGGRDDAAPARDDAGAVPDPDAGPDAHPRPRPEPIHPADRDAAARVWDAPPWPNVRVGDGAAAGWGERWTRALNDDDTLRDLGLDPGASPTEDRRPAMTDAEVGAALAAISRPSADPCRPLPFDPDDWPLR